MLSSLTSLFSSFKNKQFVYYKNGPNLYKKNIYFKIFLIKKILIWIILCNFASNSRVLVFMYKQDVSSKCKGETAYAVLRKVKQRKRNRAKRALGGKENDILKAFTRRSVRDVSKSCKQLDWNLGLSNGRRPRDVFIRIPFGDIDD